MNDPERIKELELEFHAGLTRKPRPEIIEELSRLQGTFPTAECLQPGEVELSTGGGKLPSTRRRHVAECEFCRILVNQVGAADPAPEKIDVAIAAARLHAELDGAEENGLHRNGARGGSGAARALELVAVAFVAALAVLGIQRLAPREAPADFAIVVEAIRDPSDVNVADTYLFEKCKAIDPLRAKEFWPVGRTPDAYLEIAKTFKAHGSWKEVELASYVGLHVAQADSETSKELKAMLLEAQRSKGK
jgi:hypothetical protein